MRDRRDVKDATVNCCDTCNEYCSQSQYRTIIIKSGLDSYCTCKNSPLVGVDGLDRAFVFRECLINFILGNSLFEPWVNIDTIKSNKSIQDTAKLVIDSYQRSKIVDGSKWEVYGGVDDKRFGFLLTNSLILGKSDGFLISDGSLDERWKCI
jgi:hypothetical protein